jgi:hypothetical protein
MNEPKNVEAAREPKEKPAADPVAVLALEERRAKLDADHGAIKEAGAHLLGLVKKLAETQPARRHEAERATMKIALGLEWVDKIHRIGAASVERQLARLAGVRSAPVDDPNQ